MSAICALGSPSIRVRGDRCGLAVAIEPDPGRRQVEPGDLVIADDTGVCFIPRDRILDVLELVEKKAKAEEIRCQAIVGGAAVADISRSDYGE